MRKIFTLMGALTLLLLAAASCTNGKEWHREEGAVWATSYHITYYGDCDLADSIQWVLSRVESSLSPFDKQSTISRINDNRCDSTDALIDSVMRISLAVNRLSGGRFDPTVSPIVNLWGFGYTGHPRDGHATEPTQAQIDSALSLVGLAECRIEGGRMRKKAPGTSFNFSAVTKGFGCDMIGRMLRRNGVTDYMIEVGGEMALSGTNPRNKPWRVQIDAPVEGATPGARGMRVIELTDCGVATSGNYRNFLTDSAGRHLGHTISPVTGRPYQAEIVSATVVAPTCAEADALATACMASTLPQARKMLLSLKGVKAILAIAEADSLRVINIE